MFNSVSKIRAWRKYALLVIKKTNQYSDIYMLTFKYIVLKMEHAHTIKHISEFEEF
jgi:hypothetical protein